MFKAFTTRVVFTTRSFLCIVLIKQSQRFVNISPQKSISYQTDDLVLMK